MMKMDAIKQKPQQRIQTYYDRLEQLFVKGKILNVEKRGILMVHLRLEIQFSYALCIHIKHEWIIDSDYWVGEGTRRNQWNSLWTFEGWKRGTY